MKMSNMYLISIQETEDILEVDKVPEIYLPRIFIGMKARKPENRAATHGQVGYTERVVYLCTVTFKGIART